MAITFKIHPAIGIARLGDSEGSFYLAPEGAGRLPIDCDRDGVATIKDGAEETIKAFRDETGRVRRQGARFRIYRYDDSGAGREVELDGPIEVVLPKTGQRIQGVLRDIKWTVYLANKKAVWYEFQETNGEHGYAEGHDRRNSDIEDPGARQQLIIDPGPRSVRRLAPRASFAKVDDPTMAQTFPPPLSPASIDTLGDLVFTEQPVTDASGRTAKHPRLVVLGGHGNSGSAGSGLGEPKISSFVNNDGWFDDISDGYVTANLVIEVETINGEPPVNQGKTATLPVDSDAWVIVGYPRYAPQIVDMITMDEAVYDVFVRAMAYDNSIFGVAPFAPSPPPHTPAEWSKWRADARWNPDYYPRFWRDIWPILTRPNDYVWVMDFDSFSGGDPHNTGDRGNFDVTVMSRAPYQGQDPAERRADLEKRRFVYETLRLPGQENLYQLPASSPRRSGYRLPGMPLLCGDNPITNTSPSKFLRLTETMLFLLRQWADGKFINEETEHLPMPAPPSLTPSGVELDRGVLSNLLGGAFCPGGEASWIMRNPAIYTEPYRIKRSPEITLGYLSQDDNLAVGLEPGDLTKRSGVPWQADFNECSTQSIDITYEGWNQIDPKSIGDPVVPKKQTIYWWPSHRPMHVMLSASGPQVLWSGDIPSEGTGDLAMVTAWKKLGFVAELDPKADPPAYVLVEQEKQDPRTGGGK